MSARAAERLTDVLSIVFGTQEEDLSGRDTLIKLAAFGLLSIIKYRISSYLLVYACENTGMALYVNRKAACN